jgi:hypothetical protein
MFKIRHLHLLLIVALLDLLGSISFSLEQTSCDPSLPGGINDNGNVCAFQNKVDGTKIDNVKIFPSGVVVYTVPGVGCYVIKNKSSGDTYWVPDPNAATTTRGAADFTDFYSNHPGNLDVAGPKSDCGPGCGTAANVTGTVAYPTSNLCLASASDAPDPDKNPKGATASDPGYFAWTCSLVPGIYSSCTAPAYGVGKCNNISSNYIVNFPTLPCLTGNGQADSPSTSAGPPPTISWSCPPVHVPAGMSPQSTQCPTVPAIQVTAACNYGSGFVGGNSASNCTYSSSNGNPDTQFLKMPAVNGVNVTLSTNYNLIPGNGLTSPARYASWTCNGFNQVQSVNCALTDGACGTALGKSYYAASQIPSSSYCYGGRAPVNVTNNGFSWQCPGFDANGNPAGNLSQTCNALQAVDGQCGTSNMANVSSAPTGIAACASGNLVDVNGNPFPSGIIPLTSGQYNWYCSGKNGGAAKQCSATSNCKTGAFYNGRCIVLGEGGNNCAAACASVGQTCDQSATSNLSNDCQQGVIPQISNTLYPGQGVNSGMGTQDPGQCGVDVNGDMGCFVYHGSNCNSDGSGRPYFWQDPGFSCNSQSYSFQNPSLITELCICQ